jgi:hypothetical protein
MSQKWSKNERRLSVAQLLEQFWSSLGGRPWEQKDGITARDRRLRQRLYTPRWINKLEPPPERKATASDVLYALERYAAGEAPSAISKDFAAHRIVGLSRTRLELYADRLVEFLSRQEQPPFGIDDLLKALSPTHKVDQKLPRHLVPALRNAAGAKSGLPDDLVWQCWSINEIRYFAQTGGWPPRIAYMAIRGLGLELPPVVSDEATRDTLEKSTFTGIDWRSGTSKCVAILSAGLKLPEESTMWIDVMYAQLRAEQLAPNGHQALCPRASHEAIRLALTRGRYPHRWEPSRIGPDRWGAYRITGSWIPVEQPCSTATT